jgi:hypothetical protein
MGTKLKTVTKGWPQVAVSPNECQDLCRALRPALSKKAFNYSIYKCSKIVIIGDNESDAEHRVLATICLSQRLRIDRMEQRRTCSTISFWSRPKIGESLSIKDPLPVLFRYAQKA